MNRYADPTRCPNCGAYATGTQRCVSCGLLLLGPRPELLVRILTDADRVLDELRAEAFGWQRDQRQATTNVAVASPPAWTPYPAPTRPVRRQRGRRWTVGSTLLALGALCLVVAAFVFVSVSWGALGLLGRTSVLAAVTATVGVAATVVTKRRLRGSAEALWSVFLAMLILDYLGARAYGLLGMGAWQAEHATLALGVLVAGTASAVGVAAFRGVGTRLWSAEVGAGIGTTVTLVGLTGSIPGGGFWAMAVGVVAALVAAASLRRVGLRYAAWYAAGLAGLAQFSAIGIAFSETVAHSDIRALVTHDGALHTIVASSMTYVLGAAAHTVLRRRRSEEASLVATATTAVAATPVLALPYAPAMESTIGLQIVAAVVFAGLAVAGVATRDPWSRGLRVTAAVAAVPVIALAAAWISTALTTVVAALTPIWSGEVWTTAVPIANDLGPVWLAPVVLCSLAVALLATSRYADLPILVRVGKQMRWAAVWSVFTGGFAAACLLSLPVLVIALIATGVGLITVGVARRADFQLAGIGIIVGASVIPVTAPVASVVVWSVVLVCAAAIAITMRHAAVRTVSVAVAATYLHLTVIGVADVAGAAGKSLQLSLVVCVVVVGSAVQFGRAERVRQAVEPVVAAFGAIALVAGLLLPLGWQSAMFTTLGVACGVIGLSRADRRVLAVVGGALTGIGYVLRLIASDVGVVEAYTLPFGVILLAIGYLTMRRSPRQRTSVALLPGLTMALVPSLPAVLIDPTTLRGLLLGSAAVAVLAAGARLKWQTPFVVGTALVALITVRHIGPYADAAPRWALIALAGTVMLVVGVTWESRVRNARSLASFVGAMR